MSTHKRVLLIDNYDSFTWNIYEYLCQEGADVSVFRNDKITIEEIRRSNYDIILISPGPGHPITDSGISCDVIKELMGEIPIFGVCMGQECMIQTLGGSIGFAGEIVHGKTSSITHDGKGFFKNVPQGVAVTRYHSLAADKPSLPDCFEITATTDNGVVMGVRHKKYILEGVQFHPESILTEEGHLMIRNILEISGKTWEEYYQNIANGAENSKNSNISQKPSILNEIYNKRKEDVKQLSETPGFTMKDLEFNFNLGLASSVQNFYTKLSTPPNGKRASVLAEVKRASPSKGNIDIKAISSEQALKYARAGASAISVLTEPHWFKGSLQDLVNVRRALDLEYVRNKNDRPCILRKEFIFSKYQILEARLAGADSVLLIVKMLTEQELKELYDYSKKLEMEPLVEVNSKTELQLAIKIGSKVIGVNNRDLHSFHVDLNTTSSLVQDVPSGTILVALSGITVPEDTNKYKKEGVKGFLVGEALMKAPDVSSFIEKLTC
ncbi:probable Anthranilate synthase component 2 [Saccharomycodes ludwigii]|uniref:Multifunctional tryptophan biosynthesis protein n=1 Tax=Saccharomycodes ludwigii TaxID=36035 RepID=A0A376B4Q3_9ASCO|nr:hypothetical protein SCDLUD_002231 [Saccharomycodes ludwigii]KAH3902409.1 hypothetical protein SCDLUD_002231 [Saccharomycodes ludwigii]SSD59668.1 probable Anthranilate synthase component 2 [Saccharomycodes ludwigii]